MPRHQRARARRNACQLEATVAGCASEEWRVEHHDIALHGGVNIAVHSHQASAIETVRAGLRFAVQAEIEGQTRRVGVDVMQDRIAVRKAHRTARRHNQQRRIKALAAGGHHETTRRGGRRASVRQEVNDGIQQVILRDGLPGSGQQRNPTLDGMSGPSGRGLFEHRG